MARREARAAARLAAVQALYQMDLAGTPLNEVKAEFESHWMGQEVEGERYNAADAAFFRALLDGVLGEQRRIDRDIDTTLAAGWPLKRIETILRAILRAGTFELIGRPDVPARVVISEYVDVAGAFVEREEAGMINAVLDALARKLRPDELMPPARGAAGR
jgi:N utilization substance protein B